MKNNKIRFDGNETFPWFTHELLTVEENRNNRDGKFDKKGYIVFAFLL